MAVRKLRNGNATGHDEIPAKLIKDVGKELKNVIHKFISK
jgi:hypothetical protein